MLLQTVRKYCDLGLYTTARVIAHRLRARRARKKMRSLPAHNWTMIARYNAAHGFDTFFASQKTLTTSGSGAVRPDGAKRVEGNERDWENERALFYQSIAIKSGP